MPRANHEELRELRIAGSFGADFRSELDQVTRSAVAASDDKDINRPFCLVDLVPIQSYFTEGRICVHSIDMRPQAQGWSPDPPRPTHCRFSRFNNNGLSAPNTPRKYALLVTNRNPYVPVSAV